MKPLTTRDGVEITDPQQKVWTFFDPKNSKMKGEINVFEKEAGATRHHGNQDLIFSTEKAAIEYLENELPKDIKDELLESLKELTSFLRMEGFSCYQLVKAEKLIAKAESLNKTNEQ